MGRKGDFLVNVHATYAVSCLYSQPLRYSISTYLSNGSAYLSRCLPINRTIYGCNYLSASLYLSFPLFICLPTYLTYLHTYLPIDLSISRAIYAAIHPSIHPFV